MLQIEVDFRKDLSNICDSDLIKKNIHEFGWYISLRWLAIFGILTLIPISQRLLVFNLGYSGILITTSVLIILNLFYFAIFQFLPKNDIKKELLFAELQIIVDSYRAAPYFEVCDLQNRHASPFVSDSRKL